MNSEEFKDLYSMQSCDESITPFKNEIGFSLIRKYPENTDYYKDGRRMFIKIAVIEKAFIYGVDMTKTEKRGNNVEYIITDGNEYKRKVTNFISNDSEFTFDITSKKVVQQSSSKNFSVDEFVSILVKNHLSDRLFIKRILNWFVNIILKFLFWLSDNHYERIQTSLDKYHYSKENNIIKEEKNNIEPFFKYFYISKNILFLILLVAFPSAIFFREFWVSGDFSLSNPSLLLLFFIILFSCEKFSIWLVKSIRNFFVPEKSRFNEEKRNFLTKLHDYQYQNKFKLKLNK